MWTDASSQRGFTLIETLIALALLAGVSAGVAQLFGLAFVQGHTAHATALMTAMAASRLEQLRSLEWSIDWSPSGTAVEVSDLSSDLSQEPIGAGGGGLSASPAGALDVDTPGYVDYLDQHGLWVGTAPAVPRRAMYVRRWAITPLAPAGTLGLQVLVAPLSRERQRSGSLARRWDGQDVLLATIITRQVR